MTLRINRQTRGYAAAVAAFVLSLLAGCASTPLAPVVELSQPVIKTPEDGAPPPRAAGSTDTYHVVRGDTLHTIAFKHGLDYRDIAAWNGIVPPYRIYAGQDLRLTPPAGTARSTVATSPPAALGKATPLPAGKSTSPANAPTVASAAPAASSSQSPAPLFEDVTSEPIAPAEAAKPTASASSPSAAAISAPARPESAPKGATAATASIGIKGAAAAETTARSPAPADTGTKPAVPEAPPRIAEDSVVTGSNGLSWRWPGKGALAGTFVAGDQTRQGIDIAGKAGDPVLAAGDGEVVYSGNGLLGYGELIIVKHNASFLSAYGHNRKRMVQEGDKVKAGQQIAEMGSSGSARDELHFEIRKNGKPVNPLDYLPAR